MKNIIKRGSTLLLALVLVLTLIMAVNTQVQSVYADDLNLDAFQVDISTVDTVNPGNEVTFDVQITSKITKTATARVYAFYYREVYNSETYPGEEFGEFSGAGLKDSDDGYDKLLTLEPGQSVSLTMKGTIPDTWNEKSEILVMANASDQGYMGQGDYYGTPGGSEPPIYYEKAKNTLSAKGKTASVDYSKVRKAAQSLAVTKVISFADKGQGTRTYTKASGNSKITVNKSTGKVTVKKGLKKGTYTVKVKVKAAGNEYYKASTKTVTFTIKVK